MMKFQLLLATVDSKFFMRGYVLPCKNYLVINQLQNGQSAKCNGENIIHCHEKGLSKSRNLALQKALGEICLIADDDVSYIESVETIVLDAFEKNPSADVITFLTRTPQGDLLKPDNSKKKWHTRRSVMRVISYEIAFRTQAIRNANLYFDEQFGLGAQFPTGEENIFLIDAIRSDLKVLHVPIPIVTHPRYSSGGDFSNLDLIRAKGAMFFRMFRFNAYWISALFAYRKYHMSNMSHRKFYRLMCDGISAYKQRHA